MTAVASTPGPWLSPRTAWDSEYAREGGHAWRNGQLQVPAQGTVFLVQIPLASRDVRPMGRGAPDMPARGRKIRVMIVDDHAILRAG